MKSILYSLSMVGLIFMAACQSESPSTATTQTSDSIPLKTNILKEAPPIIIHQAPLTLMQKETFKKADLLNNKTIKFLWEKPPMKEEIALGDSTFTLNLNNNTVLYSLKASNQSLSYCSSPHTSTYHWSSNVTNSTDISLDNTAPEKLTHSNEFKTAAQQMTSTMSIDVDNASYSHIRSHLSQKELPSSEGIRIEELLNYFDYDYPLPKTEHPFSIVTEIGPAPWNSNHHLIHLGIQGEQLTPKQIKPSNLVFLIDVSGSMSDKDKLPLLKQSFDLLLNKLSKKDKVSIVVYAGAAGLVLPPTVASNKKKILAALQKLEAGGSTAGGEGIDLAYEIALKNFIKGGNNRVILATDGDFNVGPQNDAQLIELIKEKQKSNVYLTICGFGMGNYQDGKMEQISNAGNGNYFYIDNLLEAQKVFVEEMPANMFTIAKDVKIQMEFNPQMVLAYRLIGYDNRRLAEKDFNDDTKDAGELGAGHTVTAIYEVILKEEISQTQPSNLMSVKLRYKPIDSDKSVLVEHHASNQIITDLKNTSDNFRFSAAVAAFGMQLKDSPFKGNSSYNMIAHYAQNALGKDTDGYRAAFLKLVKSAQYLNLQETE